MIPPCLFTPINSSKSLSLLQRSQSLLFAATNFDFFPFSPMESFALLKFWKTSTAKVAGYGDHPLPAAPNCLVSVVEEEEDSFFELEFTLPDDSPKSGSKPHNSDIKIGRIADFISDEAPDARINSKPQSPMSILRESAPKLRVLMFGKLIKKSKPEKASEPRSICTDDVSTAPKPKNKLNFTVKLRIEDGGALKKKFSGTERRNSNGGEDKEMEASSRRFSKDSVNKYLNLIKKPLNVKLSSASSNSNSNSNSNSKRASDMRAPFDCAATSAFMSPRKSEDRSNSNNRFRAPCKKLRKSRSAGALPVGVSSDDSLAQQNDGIQGAILHCKQSYNASPQEWRVMWRCGSDTSHEKSVQRSDE